MPIVTVYTKENCMMCEMTKSVLKSGNIMFEEVYMDEQVKADLRAQGVAQAPFVVAGDESWSGFRPDKLNQLKSLAAAAA